MGGEREMKPEKVDLGAQPGWTAPSRNTPSTRAPAHFQTSLWPKPPGVTEPGTGAAAPMPSGNII